MRVVMINSFCSTRALVVLFKLKQHW
jgi:hypothetical protein